MPISALPPAPQPTDTQAQFNTKAFNLVAALNTFVTEANAVETAVDADAVAAAASAASAATQAANAASAAATALSATSAITGSSVTSLGITTGSKTLSIETGRAFVAGMGVRIGQAGLNANTNYMDGDVTSYNATNGELIVEVLSVGGSGTFSSWSVRVIAGLPSQTGNAGKFLSTDGTTSSWEVALAAQSLYIFSSAAISEDGVSVLEDLTPSSVRYSTGLSSNGQILFANSLYIATNSSSSASVATSPDGETWTLRTMPATGSWYIAQDGNNLMAIIASTVVATSTDSITWTSATALPLAATNSLFPAANSGTWLVVRTNTNYLSTDFGVTWSAAETLPETVRDRGGMFVVNGYFWYIASSRTTAYYSTTGLTGSWTSVALPVLVNVVWRQNNTIYFAASGANAQVYRVDDETTFTAITNIITIFSDGPVFPVLGVWASFGGTFGTAATYHNGLAVIRKSSLSASSVQTQSYESGGVSLVPLAGGASIAKYTGANGPTAIFTV